MMLRTHFESKRPRYQLIAEELADRIASGGIPEGDLLPSEAQLCLTHGVSRHTVREAIRALSQLGLVDARPGIGTRVISQKGIGYVHHIKEISDLHAFAGQTRSRVIATSTIHGAEADIPLPGGPGKAWRMVEAVRHRIDTDDVIAWTEIFVQPRYGRALEAVESDELIYLRIERESELKTARLTQEVYAVGVPEQAALYLSLDPGAPALAVRRDYFDENDVVFEVALSLYPSEIYRNLSEFRPAMS